jgi:predicted ATP-dependent endonuclease of OLD family
MRIDFVEVRNFRRLDKIRIDFSEKTTLLVGANNSGKTAAITALRYFLS